MFGKYVISLVPQRCFSMIGFLLVDKRIAKCLSPQVTCNLNTFPSIPMAVVLDPPQSYHVFLYVFLWIQSIPMAAMLDSPSKLPCIPIRIQKAVPADPPPRFLGQAAVARSNQNL